MRSFTSDGECRPLSIFFLIRSLSMGGTERQLVYLAKGLAARGHNVTVATFYSGGVLEPDLRADGLEVVDLLKRGRWDFIGFMARLLSTVRRVQPDLMYSLLGTSNILGAFIRLVMPQIRLVWSVRSSVVNLSEYDWLARVSYRLECWLSRFADLIISNSVAGADYAILHGFSAGAMRVVPNGFDTIRFRPDAEMRARARQEWGVGQAESVIGTLARVDPVKDYPTFLRAAREVAVHRSDVRFVCVGEGDANYEAQLRIVADELGLADRIIWAGAALNPVQALNGFDVYCSPSAGEGFSNSTAEAMACAVPVVATDVGDTAIVLDRFGFLAPPHEPSRMADALLRGLEPSARELGCLARRRICEDFSLDRLIDRTEALLIEVVAEKSKE